VLQQSIGLVRAGGHLDRRDAGNACRQVSIRFICARPRQFRLREIDGSWPGRARRFVGTLALAVRAVGDEHHCMVRIRPYLLPWAENSPVADHLKSAAAVARFAFGSLELTDDHRRQRLTNAV
jgi:hypothetical protein